MEKNVLNLTDLGRQAANNASAGGILVDLVKFKAGGSRAGHQDTDLDIKGEELYAGPITFVETLDEFSCRFRFDIPSHVAPEEGMDLNEVAVFMDSNVMFGRCVLTRTYHINHGEGISIDCILTTVECDVTVLNVVIGDYVSIPVTPFVRRLPSPSEADHNTIGVLDLMSNTDTSMSAGFATRFGAGSLHWAFSTHDRIYHGKPDDGTTSATEFNVQAVVETFNVHNGENFIVQVVTGPGQGETRRYKYDTAQGVFKEADGEQFSSFGPNSYISIWRKIGGNTTLNSGLPDRDGIPPDWVLYCGIEAPVWGPVNVGGRNINTLYRSPGKTVITPITDVGDGSTSKYKLTGLQVKNANHVITAVGSATQHRTAFELQGNEIEYAENIPPNAAVDIRAITKEPSTGHYLEVVQDSYVCDGNAKRFKINASIDGPQYALVYLRGGLQALTSYTYDSANNEIVFSQMPNPGMSLEINSLVMKEEEGWSCEPSTTLFYTSDETHFIELPFSPQSKAHTFLSINGIHQHRNNYSLAENTIILGSPIPKGRSVEVMVLHNYRSEGTPQTNLSGVVTDAILSHKSLQLLRHDMEPIKLPIPGITLEAGRGMRVTGTHPNYKVESTLAEAVNTNTVFNFTTLKTENDAEEIIVTKRIEIKDDIILAVTADFGAVLGTGFFTQEGLEKIEYVVGFRTTSAREPEYGRRIKGTGEAGFAMLDSNNEVTAYANSSMTQTYGILKNNFPAGYVDIVARMRVRSANISQYGSRLSVNLNIIGLPNL